MSQPVVIVEQDGPVLVVTLNRPEKKNAVNSEVMCRLYDAWVRLDQDEDLRVAILQREIEVARRRPAEVRELALDPHRPELVRQRSLDTVRQLAD